MKQKHFGIGHIVPGTIAIFEYPSLALSMENTDRKYLDQRYGIFKGEVVAVVENGVGSYVARVKPDEKETHVLTMVDERGVIVLNLDWCKEIKRRGKGVNDFSNTGKGLAMKEYEDRIQRWNGSGFNTKHHSNYCFMFAEGLAQFALCELGLNTGGGQHVFDVDKMNVMFQYHPSIIAARETLNNHQFHGVSRIVINKKKFKKIAKAITNKCRMSLAKKKEWEESLYSNQDYEYGYDY